MDAPLVGVCYGTSGSNLPPPGEVVGLYRRNNIKGIRIYDENPTEVLEALAESGIELVLDIPRRKLQELVDLQVADAWLATNVNNFQTVRIKYIVVGSAVKPKDPEAKHVRQVISNIREAILKSNLLYKPEVTTAIGFDFLHFTGYPSQAKFTNEARNYLSPIIAILKIEETPLLANLYPFLLHAQSPAQYPLAYATFTSTDVVIRDEGRKYENLFDAMLDAVYVALSRELADKLKVIVSETGWPTGGHAAATIDNAKTYNTKLIEHVKGGTPLRPRPPGIITFIRSAFDENDRPGQEYERHYGIFYPKYEINFD